MDYEIKWNSKTKSALNQMPDKIVYTAARMLLDITLPTIPYGKTGNLRKTSSQSGVKGSSGKYHVGSYTTYASAVWEMKNVNWTTSGTNGEWYKVMWEKKKNSIIQNAVNEVTKENGFK